MVTGLELYPGWFSPSKSCDCRPQPMAWEQGVQQAPWLATHTSGRRSAARYQAANICGHWAVWTWYSGRPGAARDLARSAKAESSGPVTAAAEARHSRTKPSSGTRASIWGWRMEGGGWGMGLGEATGRFVGEGGV